MSETTIQKNRLSYKIQNFYYSKHIFIFFFTVISFIALVQFYFFIFRGLGITYYFDHIPGGEEKTIYFGDSNTWIAWILLVFPWIGYIFAFSSEILIVRMSKGFTKYVVVGRTMLVIYAIMSGIFFAAMMYLGFIIITFYNKKYLGTEEKKIISLATKYDYIGVLLFFLIFSGIFLPINLILLNSRAPVLAVFDVIGAGLGLGSWFLITKKSKWGLVGFTFSDLMFIVLYVIVGTWSAIATLFFYFTLDAASAAVWFLNENPQ